MADRDNTTINRTGSGSKRPSEDAFPEDERETKACHRSSEASSKAKQDPKKKVERAPRGVHAKECEMIDMIAASEVSKELDITIAAIQTVQRDHNTRCYELYKTRSKTLQEEQHSHEVHVDEHVMDSTGAERHPGMTSQNIWVEQSISTGVKNLGKLNCNWQQRHEFGYLKYGRDVAALLGGEIAVTDANTGVLIFGNDGKLMRTIAMKTEPNSVAANGEQIVVVDDTESVKMYKEDGTLDFDFHTLTESEVDLKSVAVMKDGTIIVGDVLRKKITQHSPTDGSILRTTELKIKPYFLAIDSKDRVVVSGSSHKQVVIVDGKGATIIAIKPTINGKPVKSCQGVCCDSSGIYIAIRNSSNNTGHIHHYDAEGRFLSCIDQGLYFPMGISFTSDGQQLAVVNRNSVKMYYKV